MSAAQGGNTIGLLWELGGDVIRFPLWWYGEGLRAAVRGIFSFVQGYSRTLGFSVWVKNIFTPMFGRYDWQSRIISVFMRLVNIIFRGFLLLILALLGVVICMLYVLLPIIAFGMALFNASAFFAL